LKNRFTAINSDQKIWIPKLNSVLYPDALVISGQPDYYTNRKDIICNPLVVVDVLSPKSQTYDLFEKFGLYQSLPSFMEYIIVSQSNAEVVKWYKVAENTWQKTEYTAISENVDLQSLGVSIPLSDIYYDVEFV